MKKKIITAFRIKEYKIETLRFSYSGVNLIEVVELCRSLDGVYLSLEDGVVCSLHEYVIDELKAAE